MNHLATGFESLPFIAQKWLRFDLRAMLAMTAFFCIVFGLAARDLRNFRYNAESEQTIVQRIDELGGTCTQRTRGPKWVDYIPTGLRPQLPEFVTHVGGLQVASTNSTYSSEVDELLDELRFLEGVSFEGDDADYFRRRWDQESKEELSPTFHVNFTRLRNKGVAIGINF